MNKSNLIGFKIELLVAMAFLCGSLLWISSLWINLPPLEQHNVILTREIDDIKLDHILEPNKVVMKEAITKNTRNCIIKIYETNKITSDNVRKILKEVETKGWKRYDKMPRSTLYFTKNLGEYQATMSMDFMYEEKKVYLVIQYSA